MFADEIKFYSDKLAKVNIITSTIPSVFPLNSDPIDGMQNGIKLSPGSTIRVAMTKQVFILGTNDDWVEQ